jgi:phosphatidylglycerol:prolipoprotein diacylglycerol transferase
MEPVTIAIDPVLIHIGTILVRWYGVAIAVGIALGIVLALREARRKGVDVDATYNTALWSVVIAIVGARLFHVVDRIDFYLQNPSSALSIRQGGLAMWGAIVGGSVAGALYCRWAKLSVGRMADIAAPAILLGQIVGRLGSLINGDAFGSPADLPWSLVYVHPDALIPDLGEPTHPYPLYEMLWNAVALGIVWRLRRRQLPDGTLFLVFLVLYAVGRFVLTFVRQEAIVLAGLQQAQIVALAALAVALPLLVRRRTALVHA